MKFRDLANIIHEVVLNPTNASLIAEEVKLAFQSPDIDTVRERIEARRKFVAVVRQHKPLLGLSEEEISEKKRRKKTLNEGKVKVFAQMVDDGLRQEVTALRASQEAREKSSFCFFLDQMREDFRQRIEEQLEVAILPMVLDSSANNPELEAAKLMEYQSNHARSSTAAPRYISKVLIPQLAEKLLNDQPPKRGK